MISTLKNLLNNFLFFNFYGTLIIPNTISEIRAKIKGKLENFLSAKLLFFALFLT